MKKALLITAIAAVSISAAACSSKKPQRPLQLRQNDHPLLKLRRG